MLNTLCDELDAICDWTLDGDVACFGGGGEGDDSDVSCGGGDLFTKEEMLHEVVTRVRDIVQDRIRQAVRHVSWMQNHNECQRALASFFEELGRSSRGGDDGCDDVAGGVRDGDAGRPRNDDVGGDDDDGGGDGTRNPPPIIERPIESPQQQQRQQHRRTMRNARERVEAFLRRIEANTWMAMGETPQWIQSAVSEALIAALERTLREDGVWPHECVVVEGDVIAGSSRRDVLLRYRGMSDQAFAEKEKGSGGGRHGRHAKYGKFVTRRERKHGDGYYVSRCKDREGKYSQVFRTRDAREAALYSDAFHLDQHWDRPDCLAMLNFHPRHVVNEDGVITKPTTGGATDEGEGPSTRQKKDEGTREEGKKQRRRP